MAFIPCKIGGGGGENKTISSYAAYVTTANTRAAALTYLNVSEYSTLSVSKLSKDSGVTVRSADIRDSSNNIIYTMNVSNSEQTFDISNYSVVGIYLDISSTTAWSGLIATDIILS